MDGDLLLERGGETARIEAALAQAGQGSGGLVLVEGAPGIGKTRLLAGAVATAQRSGALVLRARAGQLERSFAFGVVRQLFEPVLHRAGAEERARHLEGAADLAAPLFDPSRLGEALGETVHPLLHGLHWLSANLSRDRPLVLAVDDAQWADDPSLLFLEFLARRVADLPIVLLVGTRPLHADSPQALAELAAGPASVRLLPAPLSDAATATLLEERLGTASDAAFTSACRSVTGGNPFLLGELVRLLRSAGTAPTASMAATVGTLGTAAVRDGVLLRVSRLPPSAQALVTAIAILGDGAELADAAAHAGLAVAEAEAAAQQLREAGVLSGARRPAFAHPVLRTAVYDEIEPGDRQRGHVAAAQALITAGRPVEQVAAHLLAVPHALGAWVLAPLREAAGRALALGDVATAQQLLRRALLEDLPEDAETGLLATLGHAQVLSTDAAAGETLGMVLTRSEDPDLAARAALDLGLVLLFTGQIEPFVRVLGTTEARIAGQDPDAAAMLGAGLVFATTLSFSAAGVLADRVEALGDIGRLAVGPVERAGLIGLAWRELLRDRPVDVVRDVLDRAIATVDDAGQRFRVPLLGRLAAGAPLIAAELHDATHAMSSQELEIARRTGSGFDTVAALGLRALNGVRRGDLTGAETDAREALELAAAIGFQGFSVAMAQACLITCAIESGAAAPELRAHLTGPAPDPDLVPNGVLILARAQARAALGDHEGALAELDGAAVVYADASPSFLAWRSTAAASLASLGRRDEAVALADEELRRARSSGAPGALGRALRCRARLADEATAHDLLAEAVETLARSAARLEQARAFVDLGSWLRRSGSRVASREPLRSGLDLAMAAGSTALAERARAELASSGLRLARPGLSGARALTPSERRVAEMAAQGLRNREIAQGLFVTEKTVETHLSRTYDKLSISSRSGLAIALAT